MSVAPAVPESNAATPLRSTFVTVVAWIFIILSGFSTFMSILQNVMITLMFSANDMRKTPFPTVDPQTGKEIPSIFQFLFDHFQLFFLAFLVVSATTLVASIGLLKRKNWARILFIAIMALGIVWNIAGVAMMIPMLSMFPGAASSAKQPGFADNFDIMWKVMAGVNVLFVAGFVWLFGWIIKRLASEKIRQEFASH